MDFGRRHTFPGSEIKDVIFMAQQAAKASDYWYQLPKPRFPNAVRRGPSDTCTGDGLFHRKV